MILNTNIWTKSFKRIINDFLTWLLIFSPFVLLLLATLCNTLKNIVIKKEKKKKKIHAESLCKIKLFISIACNWTNISKKLYTQLLIYYSFIMYESFFLPLVTEFCIEIRLKEKLMYHILQWNIFQGLYERKFRFKKKSIGLYILHL